MKGNTKSKCGCVVWYLGVNKYRVDYCPKHKAVDDLYEALKALRGKFLTAAAMADLSDKMIARELEASDQALAKAEGK